MDDPALRRHLGTIGGVFAPVALSQFSSVIFMRVGLLVGQSGLLYALLLIILAYAILYLTVLSVCAISTNGAVSGGGVYFMLSRTLGPEIGGSIGILFFVSQVFSAALYLSALIETFVANFGPDGKIHSVLQGDSFWYRFGYAAAANCFCMIVLFLGSKIFAKFANLIFVVVIAIIIAVYVSFFRGFMQIGLPRPNPVIYTNTTPINETIYANFTGFSAETLSRNLRANFTVDYISGDQLNLATVFAILVSGVTGIMAGANMSGELKNPAKAIPRGTIAAISFTALIYITLCIFTAATCDRLLIVNDYVYMQDIAHVPIMIFVGAFCTTLTAALANMIGASRVIESIALDNLFGVLLRPLSCTDRFGNPLAAVLLTHVGVQLVLLIGSLNAIAPAVTVFFLLAYTMINFACMVLSIANAANFRPLFPYFHWFASMVGGMSCLTMCFVVQPVYSVFAIFLLAAIAFLLAKRHLKKNWGSVGQAFLFHQVRKYLLLIDEEESHEKYWRPHIVLLAAHPRSAASLVRFMNGVKKGGLYVIGHVLGPQAALEHSNDDASATPDVCSQEKPLWRSYARKLNVKAFVEITHCVDNDLFVDSMLHIIRLAGLGAMKPNTVCLGFYDNDASRDTYRNVVAPFKSRRPRRGRSLSALASDLSNLVSEHPDLSPDEAELDLPQLPEDKKHFFKEEQYVDLLRKIDSMGKNILVARNFHKLYCDEHGEATMVASSSTMESQPGPGARAKPHPPVYVCDSTGESVGLRCVIEDGDVSTPGKPTSWLGGRLQKKRDQKTPVARRTVHTLLQSDEMINYLDLWPFDLVRFLTDPQYDSANFGITEKFMLQVACLAGRSKTTTPSSFHIRIMVPVRMPSDEETAAFVDRILGSLGKLVSSLRINASIDLVPIDVDPVPAPSNESDILNALGSLNSIIKSKSMKKTAVVLFNLPKPTDMDAGSYLKRLTALSEDLPPTLFVHALREVNTVEI